MKLPTLKPFIIALDPGQNTGFAFLRQRDLKLSHSGTSDFYDVQLMIAKAFPDNRSKIIAGVRGRNEKRDVRIFIEHPPRILFGRNNKADLTTEQREDIISKCGGTRREAELLYKCLTRRGYECYLIPPINEPKWSYHECSLITGSKKQTTEHERDAIRIAIYKANWRPNFR